ncbi:MAG: hypothetical protein K2P78_01930 [Gemmataceae bacterium]|nr:hypothetical protein [Gemmataceae bacterium]
MPKQYDATLKDLIRAFPAHWLAQLGVPVTAPPKVLSADLSAVTAAADTLIQVGGLVVHIDVESGPDDSLARRMLLYNVLAHHHTGLPVQTIAVLLRSNAQRANLSDRVEYEGLSFRFDVVKVWELPTEGLVQSPIGLVPLAVLGKPPAGKTRAQVLPELVPTIVDRAVGEAGDRAAEVITSALILAGMHHGHDFLRAIFQGATNMIESSAYKLLEELGRQKLTRDMIRKLGTVKFGEPTDAEAAKLAAVDNLPRLERLAIRLLKVDSWDALLRGR